MTAGVSSVFSIQSVDKFGNIRDTVDNPSSTADCGNNNGVNLGSLFTRFECSFLSSLVLSVVSCVHSF